MKLLQSAKSDEQTIKILTKDVTGIIDLSFFPQAMTWLSRVLCLKSKEKPNCEILSGPSHA